MNDKRLEHVRKTQNGSGGEEMLDMEKLAGVLDRPKSRQNGVLSDVFTHEGHKRFDDFGEVEDTRTKLKASRTDKKL